MSKLSISRLALVVVLPSLILTGIAWATIYFFFDRQLESRVTAYGEATIVPIAELMAEYVEHENVLAVTILATRLRNETNIESIEIYDVSDGLLAQAGRDVGGRSFSRQLTYQDSTIGHIRITVASAGGGLSLYSLGPVAGAYLLFLLLTWQLREALGRWLTGVSREKPDTRPLDTSTEETSEALPEPEESGEADITTLVVKIRPARHLDQHLAAFEAAVHLHRGEVESVSLDELVATFPSAFDCGCSGLLIQHLAADLHGNMTYGAAMQVTGAEDIAAHKKRLSYLASVADGELLCGNEVVDHVIPDQFEMAAFQHALIDTDDILWVQGLVGSNLIHNQAAELISDHGDTTRRL